MPRYVMAGTHLLQHEFAEYIIIMKHSLQVAGHWHPSMILCCTAKMWDRRQCCVWGLDSHTSIVIPRAFGADCPSPPFLPCQALSACWRLVGVSPRRRSPCPKLLSSSHQTPWVGGCPCHSGVPASLQDTPQKHQLLQQRCQQPN